MSRRSARPELPALQPALPVMLWRGLRRRCPRCGSGGLFPGWFRMVDECPGCGIHFEHSDAFFLGAFVINFGVTELMLAAAIAGLVWATLPDPPVGLIIGLCVAVTIVVPLVFYPFSRTVWAAFDRAMRPDGPEELRRHRP